MIVEAAILPIDQILNSPTPVRAAVGDVSELARSIKERGLINPLTVTAWPADGDGPPVYVLIAGHRRLEAARQAGLTEVPVTVRVATDTSSLIDQITENIHREDLLPSEQARSMLQLTELGLTQREIAKSLGVSQPFVSRRLKLMELPEQVGDLIDAGGLHIKDADDLAKLKNEDRVLDVVEKHQRTGQPIEMLVAEALRKAAKPEEPPAPVEGAERMDAQGEPATGVVESDETKPAPSTEAASSASRTRALNKAARTREEFIINLLKARPKKSVEQVLTSLILGAGRPQLDRVCRWLNVPRHERTNGFGQEYDLRSYLDQNPADNSWKLINGLVLSRGHDLLAAKYLSDLDQDLASLTLDILEGLGYEPSEIELELVGEHADLD